MSQIVNSGNGNGNNPERRIEKVYEPLDEERWVELDTETGRREIASSDDVREKLGEDDEESN